MSEDLDPSGREVRVGSVVLRTPGLRGRAELHEPIDGDLRGPDNADEEFTKLLDEQGIRRDETIEISDASEEPGADDVGARRTAYGEPGIEIDVSAPNEGYEKVVLYTDESGVTTWNFAQAADGTQDVSRGTGGMRTYVLRRYAAPAGDGRGILGDLGRKYIRVLAFRIADPAIGRVADFAVDRWEAKHHPYRLRTFTLDDKSAPGSDLAAADLGFYRAGRALLFIHGTGSSTAGGLGGLDDAVLAKLHEHYAGRVLAFDHPTVGTAPRDNARELLALMQGDGWKLDIVSHSRGGLVARYLIEQSSDLAVTPGKVEVRRVVFAGVPNAGTPLADMDHMQAFVDSYTTLLNLLAHVLPAAATLGTIVAVVKQIAASAINGLVGLQAMDPDGDFLSRLNRGPGGPEQYYALASNYEPPPGSGLAAFRNAVTDSVFKMDNDLIVPTDGVFRLHDGADLARFPVAQVRQFGPADAVDHSAFFRTSRGCRSNLAVANGVMLTESSNLTSSAA